MVMVIFVNICHCGCLASIESIFANNFVKRIMMVIMIIDDNIIIE